MTVLSRWQKAQALKVNFKVSFLQRMFFEWRDQRGAHFLINDLSVGSSQSSGHTSSSHIWDDGRRQ